MSQKLFVAAGLWFLVACATVAQTPAPQTPPATAPSAAVIAANPADVSSPDAILAATYDVISGPAGDRNWNRMRSLFHPSARLVRAGPQEGGRKSRPVLLCHRNSSLIPSNDSRPSQAYCPS